MREVCISNKKYENVCYGLQLLAQAIGYEF